MKLKSFNRTEKFSTYFRDTTQYYIGILSIIDHRMQKKHNNGRFWWEREDLVYHGNRLIAAGQDLYALVQSSGTPVFAYSAGRVLDNLRRLANALERKDVRFKIYYALKANRFLPLVTALRLSSLCGIDVCSPAELLLARQVGVPHTDLRALR